MPDLMPVAQPKKRGPKTPEGKARSSRNALRHGLRARTFCLVPEDDPEEWRRHVLDLETVYGPTDAVEQKLVDAIAVAMWREIRADRFEAEALTASEPSGAEQQPRQAALTTALCYQGSASMATRRALRAFLEHRKARQSGLIVPVAVAVPALANDTNDLSARTSEPEPLGRRLVPRPPAPKPEPAAPVAADPDAWLAKCPVVEADPSDESLRRALLGLVEHPIMREMMLAAPLKGIEQFVVSDDPVAYEEWFAKQPKVPFGHVDVPESYKADIERVTRHNPPWARGEYLSYYRPPVPAHLFAPQRAKEAEPDAAAEPAAPAAPAPAEPSLAELQGRIARLLDRTQPRLPEELDLAEAICAVRWPNWPAYRGSIDLFRLRRALQGTVIDARTLHWLGGKEIERQCRAGAGK